MSFNKTKSDPELGQKVHEHLVKMGVETPTINNGLSRTDKIEIIETKFADIMNALGLDYDAFPKCTAVDNKMKYNEMVCERNINVQSNCEHHFVVIDGLATIAYVPKDKVLGLSKINRIVEYFSKRPQIQERLTEQIFHALQYILETEDVAVVINARHYCVRSRGVEDTGSSTVTSRLGGGFKTDPAARAEFMRMVSLNDLR